MDIRESCDHYSEALSVENAQVDSRRLILYDFPPVLNENGIYNFLEHIECTPSSITLRETHAGEDQAEPDPYEVASKTASIAIVEFSSKSLVDKAFYVITSHYKQYFNAQYAHHCRSSHISYLALQAAAMASAELFADDLNLRSTKRRSGFVTKLKK